MRDHEKQRERDGSVVHGRRSPPPSNITRQQMANSAADVKATKLESLTIVSMNIAACVPSQSAPSHWNYKMSNDTIRKEIPKQDPDIIALQECPGGIDWAAKVFPLYQPAGATYSHADQVVLLIRNGIGANPVSIDDIACHRG